MMSSSTGCRASVILGLTLLMFSLIGCSGDPRPLEEAVEASELGLISLTIQSDHPVIEADPDNITIGPGDIIRFSFTALGEQNETLIVENTNRRWSVSNGDVASISDTGVLVGQGNGTVQVGLRIGGIIASPVSVTVSDAALVAISAIQGQQILTECSVSEEYSALGAYADGTTRIMTSVDWAVSPGSQGVGLEFTVDSAIVGALAPGSITLEATSEGISGTRIITVAQGLQTLSLGEVPIEVERAATKQLEARATYTDGVTSLVTELVTWGSGDEDIATVSNDSGSNGIVTGVAVGQTLLTIGCGDATANQLVQVIVPADVIRLNVSPDDDPIILNLTSDRTLQLDVSAESSAGSIEIVTNRSDWRISAGDDIVSVDNSGSERGLLTALAVGTATLEISYLGIEKSITVRVQ